MEDIKFGIEEVIQTRIITGMIHLYSDHISDMFDGNITYEYINNYIIQFLSTDDNYERLEKEIHYYVEKLSNILYICNDDRINEFFDNPISIRSVNMIAMSSDVLGTLMSDFLIKQCMNNEEYAEIVLNNKYKFQELMQNLSTDESSDSF